MAILVLRESGKRVEISKKVQVCKTSGEEGRTNQGRENFKAEGKDS